MMIPVEDLLEAMVVTFDETTRSGEAYIKCSQPRVDAEFGTSFYEKYPVTFSSSGGARATSVLNGYVMLGDSRRPVAVTSRDTIYFAKASMNSIRHVSVWIIGWSLERFIKPNVARC